MVMEYVFKDDYVEEQIKAFNVPEYDEGGVTVTYRDAVGRLDSYFNVEYRATPLRTPILRIDGETWMSLTPMEIQSQEVAASMMEGQVGILGLGLGYIVWRAMENTAVDDIYVFEQNPRVIEYFENTFKDRPGFDKVFIVGGDARDTCKGYEFDVLFNDIYQTLLPDEIIPDIELFCTQNLVETYRFWGQERVYLDHLQEQEEPYYNMPYADRALLASWMRTESSSMYRPMCDEEYYTRVLEMMEKVA